MLKFISRSSRLLLLRSSRLTTRSFSSVSSSTGAYTPLPSHFYQTECGLFVDRSLPPNFKKILIANRGEIACRVIRTCKALGIKTVAIYSDADAQSKHVQMADEAYRIGPPAASQSYLLGDKILEIAKASGAQAIHPGYGFLSENAGFARLCEEKGIVFIGPPATAIIQMGSKSQSKLIMEKAKVPVVPGFHNDDVQDPAVLKQKARDVVGYPLMIKAVSGGGGKGMRIVKSEEEFDEMLESAKREAMASFKDDRVLLEKYIVRPRHIEFQIFADKHGNAVHLYERDCSVQRRHQKVFEEAPAPGMTAALREQMGKSACDAAKAVGYVGAGTVEFIFDADTGDYYFMEMNTRLQVEHPVSEMIVRRDLVQWQLHVAFGLPLPVSDQSQVQASGHAIEARVYAENPWNQFLPATGHLSWLRPPSSSSLFTPASSLSSSSSSVSSSSLPSPLPVRVESGVREGDTVSMFYDPMISKLLVWAEDRPKAIKRMEEALRQYQVCGVVNNIPFLLRCVKNEEFKAGGITTQFIGKNLEQLVPRSFQDDDHIFTSAAFYFLLQVEKQRSSSSSSESALASDPWNSSSSFRLNHPSCPRPLSLQSVAYGEDGQIKTEEIQTTLSVDDKGEFHFKYGKSSCVVHGSFVPLDSQSPSVGAAGNLHLLFTNSKTKQQQSIKATCVLMDNSKDVYVFINEGAAEEDVVARFQLTVKSFSNGDAGHAGSVAPMSGKIVKIMCKEGQHVKKGSAVAVMEAMKMEHVIRAAADGVVEKVEYGVGDFVDGGKVVVKFKSNDE